MVRYVYVMLKISQKYINTNYIANAEVTST